MGVVFRADRDIFTSEMGVLTNPVNCLGISGAGLAKQFARRFTALQQRYVEHARSGGIRLGKPVLFEERDHTHAVLYFPTKLSFRDDSRLEDIEAGLIHLKQSLPIRRVIERRGGLALPMLGCGLGRLGYKDVLPLLFEHLCDLDYPVEIYCADEHVWWYERNVTFPTT